MFDFLVLLVALLSYPAGAVAAPDTIQPCSFVVGNVTNDDSFLAVVSGNLTACSPSSWLPNDTNVSRTSLSLHFIKLQRFASWLSTGEGK